MYPILRPVASHEYHYTAVVQTMNEPKPAPPIGLYRYGNVNVTAHATTNDRSAQHPAEIITNSRTPKRRRPNTHDFRPIGPDTHLGCD